MLVKRFEVFPLYSTDLYFCLFFFPFQAYRRGTRVDSASLHIYLTDVCFFIVTFFL